MTIGDKPPLLSADAALVAALFAVDPAGSGGVALRAAHGPWRDAWLVLLRGLLPPSAPWRRVPLHIADERLLGGLDLGATLQAGRPVAQRGVLAEADGGVLLLAMAERLAGGTAARIGAVMDGGAVCVERDGIGLRDDARFGVVALDEGIGDDEALPAALRDRLGLWLAADAVPAPPRAARPADGQGPRSAAAGSAPPALQARQHGVPARGERPAAAPVGVDAFDQRPAAPCSAADVLAARQRLPAVTAADDIVQALCAAALALGVPSLRAALLAVRVARAAAALAGRDAVDVDDAVLAARLVLAPRATQLPAPPPPPPSEVDADPLEGDPDAASEPAAATPPPATPGPSSPPAAPSTERASMPSPDRRETADGAIEDAVLAAALAAIPAGLLAALQLGPALHSQQASPGRVGALELARLRGRPSGVRRGEPTGGARLNVLETLRAAAPWQRLRRAECADDAPAVAPAVRIRRDDFRVTRFKQRSVTTTIFAVDASGSAALHRLAEAKGAVELLLADCYVRRDHVALLAFRGRTAELLLPPTRSLVRAKRSLAGLPGGGGTPLAAGIDAAAALADAARRRGETPIVVLLTDGRANIARDGAPGRPRAGDDALAAARQFRAAGFTALLLDTSAQPQPTSAALAREMGAFYLPLPHAGAAGMSQAVLTVQAARQAASGTALRPAG